MSIIVDGKKIALDIQKELQQLVAECKVQAVFHMIYVGSDPVIDNYLKHKKKFAEKIGVQAVVHRFTADIGEANLIEEIKKITQLGEPTIIQLPLPGHLDTQSILNLIPVGQDVDVLSELARKAFAHSETLFIPPVTASILEICKRYDVSFKDKKIVLVGDGLLVGKPMGQWLARNNYPYDVVHLQTGVQEKTRLLASADILISGAGVPELINKDMLKPGVVVIDAGTSESSAKIIGDIHRDVTECSSLFTPVPGGVGPMTIALLYTNVVKSYHHA